MFSARTNGELLQWALNLLSALEKANANLRALQKWSEGK